MQDVALARLVDLTPPPPSITLTADWTAVERTLGIALPADYKRLIDVYGLGQFDGFLWVLHPSTPNPNLRLDSAYIGWYREMLAKHKDRFAATHNVVPWATTDNGDVAYWVTDDLPPDDWTVAVNEARGPDWSVSDLAAVAWLEAVLSGRLVVDLFPDDFPTRSPLFEPYSFEAV